MEVKSFFDAKEFEAKFWALLSFEDQEKKIINKSTVPFFKIEKQTQRASKGTQPPLFSLQQC